MTTMVEGITGSTAGSGPAGGNLRWGGLRRRAPGGGGVATADVCVGFGGAKLTMMVEGRQQWTRGCSGRTVIQRRRCWQRLSPVWVLSLGGGLISV